MPNNLQDTTNVMAENKLTPKERQQAFELAEKWGLSEAVVQKIIKRKKWADEWNALRKNKDGEKVFVQPDAQ